MVVAMAFSWTSALNHAPAILGPRQRGVYPRGVVDASTGQGSSFAVRHHLGEYGACPFVDPAFRRELHEQGAGLSAIRLLKSDSVFAGILHSRRL